jgi:NitT/TauT family transport system permease protein
MGLVGVSARAGLIGWFVYTGRAQLETASVFAGLLTVILIGLVMEGVIFRTLARTTVQRRGPGTDTAPAATSP